MELDRQELEVRLRRLERLVRWTGTFAGAAFLMLVCVAFAPGVEESRGGKLLDEELRVRCLQLVDSNGRVGLELDANSLSLRGEDSAGNVFLCQLLPQGLGVIKGSEDSPAAVLEVNTHEIDLIDYEKERRAVIQSRMFGLQRGIHGESEFVAWNRFGEHGIRIQDEQGRPRARLGPDGTDETAYYGLTVYDEKGEVLGAAP